MSWHLFGRSCKIEKPTVAQRCLTERRGFTMTIKRAMLFAALALATLPLGAAQAGVYIGIGVPVYRPYYRPRVVVVAPVVPVVVAAPVVVAPAPPPPVYAVPAPQPMVVQPAPVVMTPAPLPAQPIPVH